ncbi:hypothetical protein VT25_17680 [Photobacterium leiognathi subsp. mandapamensis]|nr:hypothetical protein VT25_17680 [Photobacterium leiognathi subsp. mandapamensis]
MLNFSGDSDNNINKKVIKDVKAIASQTVPKPIHCKEKTIANVFFIFSFVLFLALLLITIAFIRNESAGIIWLFAMLPFVAFLLLMFFIGRYYRKKYNLLGDTPLYLPETQYTLGRLLPAMIEIDHPQFTRVANVTLCCLQSTSGRSSAINTVWQSDIMIEPEYSNNQTHLLFNLFIPTSEKATDTSGFSKAKYVWEVSFEYIDKMTKVKRSWVIPVV